eukprot:UN01450
MYIYGNPLYGDYLEWLWKSIAKFVVFYVLCFVMLCYESVYFINNLPAGCTKGAFNSSIVMWILLMTLLIYYLVMLYQYIAVTYENCTTKKGTIIGR